MSIPLSLSLCHLEDIHIRADTFSGNRYLCIVNCMKLLKYNSILVVLDTFTDIHLVLIFAFITVKPRTMDGSTEMMGVFKSM